MEYTLTNYIYIYKDTKSKTNFINEMASSDIAPDIQEKIDKLEKSQPFFVLKKKLIFFFFITSFCIYIYINRID